MEHSQLDSFHQESCSKRLETCQYCQMMLSFDLLQEHQTYCGTRAEPCSMCKKHVLVKEKENHVNEKCPKRLVSCTYCQLEYPFDELGEHAEFCVDDSEPCNQETVVYKRKGSHPKKPYKKEIATRQGDAIPFTHDRHLEHIVSYYNSPFCEAGVPTNEFRAHYEESVENAQTFNQFPRHNKTVDTSFECEITGLCENPNSDDKKCDMDSMCCRLCGYQCAVHELQEHLKQCHYENCILCVCGEYVLQGELSNHGKNCPQRMKSCRLCRKKCAVGEYENHLKSCPMSAVTCEFCGTDLLQYAQESHSCTKGNRKNRMKSKTKRLQQNNDLVVNQSEIKELEDVKNETECCPFCERHFPFILLKEHIQACFLLCIKCTHCSITFPVDEFSNHLCPVLSKQNRMKLNSTDDKVFVNSLDGRELSSWASKYQENNQVVQNIDLSAENKHCPVVDAEHSEFMGNLNCGKKDELHSQTGGHVQTSCADTENQNRKHVELYHFCTLFDVKELEEHLTQCDSNHFICATCGVSVKFKEKENLRKLCDKKGKCQFCKRCYPPSMVGEHFCSCFVSSVTCELCEKAFSRGEFEDHLCSVDARKQKEGLSQHLKHSNNRESKECSENYKQCEQNTETGESSDQPVEVDEEIVEAQSALEGSYQAEASRTEITYLSGGEVVAHVTKPKENVFMCKICDEKKPLENLSISTFSWNKTSVCVNCVRNIKQLNPDFARDTYSSASSPPNNEDASQSADTAEKKKGLEREVKPCEFCEVYLPLDALAGHTRMCKSRPVECSRCESLILLSDVEAHDRICNEEQLDESYSGVHGGSPVNSSGEKEATSSDQDFFKCKICNQKTPVKNISISMFKGSETSVCVNCVRNLNQLKLDVGNTSSSASYQPAEGASWGADAVEKKKRPGQEVVTCQYCNKELSYLMKEHEEMCGLRFRRCKECNSVVPVCNMKYPCENGHQAKQESSFPTVPFRDPLKRIMEAQGINTLKEVVTCQYCNKKLSYLMKAHEKRCGLRFRICEKCNALVQVCNMKYPCESGHQGKQETSFPTDISQGGDVVKKKEKPEEKCDDCGQTVSYAEIGDHKKTCEMRIEQCLFCDQPVLYFRLRQHIRQYCQGSPSTRGTKEENRSGLPYKQDAKMNALSAAAQYLGGRVNSQLVHSPQGRNDLSQQDSNYRHLPAYRRNIIRQPESVKLPCEFCGKICPEDKLIMHQSGCRPDLFTGSEDDSKWSFTPQNRRHVDDDSVPPDRKDEKAVLLNWF